MSFGKRCFCQTNNIQAPSGPTYGSPVRQMGMVITPSPGRGDRGLRTVLSPLPGLGVWRVPANPALMDGATIMPGPNGPDDNEFCRSPGSLHRRQVAQGILRVDPEEPSLAPAVNGCLVCSTPDGCGGCSFCIGRTSPPSSLICPRMSGRSLVRDRRSASGRSGRSGRIRRPGRTV